MKTLTSKIGKMFAGTVSQSFRVTFNSQNRHRFEQITFGEFGFKYFFLFVKVLYLHTKS